MSAFTFPRILEDLLTGSEYAGPIHLFARRASEMLGGSTTPFFPSYTDHGVEHVNAVLKAEVGLIPEEVIAQSQPSTRHPLLNAADATVLIGATILHDIAMHLHPGGFKELIDPNTRFKPLDWFSEKQEDHEADLPWNVLWNSYTREARRFGERTLVDLVGKSSVESGWRFDRLPEDMGQWEANHKLIIGEFIRRHHARLAHEIAIYGFPGIPTDDGPDSFPALGAPKHPLSNLADLIGLTARSHWKSLRVCKAYLDQSALLSGTPRPMEVAALYPMALLRVADYLQIDQPRAPTVLMQLKAPQSPLSVQEWRKHGAIRSVTRATGARALMVTVSHAVDRKLYLQLRELLDGMQKEMDHASAVLDEYYGSEREAGLDRLGLNIRRVRSNLRHPAYLAKLPYLAERTGLSADPQILNLLVEPLYGYQPGVAVRELIQNSVDAMRELAVWRQNHPQSSGGVQQSAIGGDVLIEFVQQPEAVWMLRVTDKGIGMTPETIQSYFLRAGASFCRSSEWMAEYTDDQRRSQVLRSGRFGIGLFSAFLLGSTIKVKTRHASSADSPGYEFEFSVGATETVLRKNRAIPVGTTIEVQLRPEAATYLGLANDSVNLEVLSGATAWFHWEFPAVERRIVHNRGVQNLPQIPTVPMEPSVDTPGWFGIQPPGFEAVVWGFDEQPKLLCNGIQVGYVNRRGLIESPAIEWSKEVELSAPASISVHDAENYLPLTVQRFGLTRRSLPFEAELIRDAMFSFIAYALVCAPGTDIASDPYGWQIAKHPLAERYYHTAGATGDEDWLSRGLLRWCSTKTGFTVADPWLYSLLQTNVCLLCGVLATRQEFNNIHYPPFDHGEGADHATALWDYPAGPFRHQVMYGDDFKLIKGLCKVGVPILGHKVTASRAKFLSISTKDDAPSPDLTVETIHVELEHLQQYQVTFGSPPTNSLLGDIPVQMYTALQNALNRNVDNRIFMSNPVAMAPYAAEIYTENLPPLPESMIAKLWRDHLGPRAIPFDSEARGTLVEEMHHQPALSKHIKAWQEMKRTGSRWIRSQLNDAG